MILGPLVEAALDEVEAEEFVLSWGRDDDRLARSIEKAGLASPPVLRHVDDGYLAVCGRRRLAVLRRMGIDRFPAFALPAGTTVAEAVTLAVEENLGHRDFNEAEKALAVDALCRALPEDDVRTRFARRIGLPPSPRHLARCRKLAAAGTEILDALASGSMDPESALIITQLDPDDREAFLSLFDTLQPGRNKREKILTWTVEIARRENLTPSQVLADDAVRETLRADNLQRGQKEARVREYLRRRRHPELARLEDRRADLLKSAPLPEDVRFSGDPAFEGLGYELALPFRDLEDYRRKSAALARLADDPAFHELLDLG